MTGDSEHIAEACSWMIRARDPDFGDWAGLVAWLEADPEHLEAYQRAQDLDAWVLRALTFEIGSREKGGRDSPEEET